MEKSCSPFWNGQTKEHETQRTFTIQHIYFSVMLIDRHAMYSRKPLYYVYSCLVLLDSHLNSLFALVSCHVPRFDHGLPRINRKLTDYTCVKNLLSVLAYVVLDLSPHFSSLLHMPNTSPCHPFPGSAWLLVFWRVGCLPDFHTMGKLSSPSFIIVVHSVLGKELVAIFT